MLLHETKVWDGSGTAQFILPTIEIISFKDS